MRRDERTENDRTDADELRYCYALLHRGGFPAVPRAQIAQYLKAQVETARLENRPGDEAAFGAAERAWLEGRTELAMAALSARMRRVNVGR